MPACARVKANEPKTRFAELRRSLDMRFADILDRLRDELAGESPEVRAEALAWLQHQNHVSYDVRAQYINLALTQIRMAERVERACGPDPQALTAA